MREIKFRYWDKDNKKMLNPYDESGTNEETWSPYWYKLQTMLDHFNDGFLMQYTGFKDKNGKEIYEEDIIKITRKYSEYDEDEGNWEVYWNYDRWGLGDNIKEYDNGEEIYWENDRCEMEVIGNIYENPELLEVNHE